MSAKSRSKHPQQKTRGQRLEEMARKKVERQVRHAYQQEKMMQSYLADDENYGNFTSQLGKMGLQLRDIPGDGNCLFRALGDQLEGHCRNHYKHRLDTCQFMVEHRKDFEPFVEDDVPFERYITQLKKPATYGGNDSIVAFARLHGVNIVIHQMNSPPWMIQGNDNAKSRQLHISYHNGDHYSSVRKTGDNTESPAFIKLKSPISSTADTPNGTTTFEETVMNAYVEDDDAHVARAVKSADDVEDHIMKMTGCSDRLLVRDTLQDNFYNVDSSVDAILAIMSVSNGTQQDDTSSLGSHQTYDSGIWSENGTATRIFGADITNGDSCEQASLSSGYDSINSQGGTGARPKIKPQANMGSKQTRVVKKQQKKQRAAERHRQKISGAGGQVVNNCDHSDPEETVVNGMGTLKI